MTRLHIYIFFYYSCAVGSFSLYSCLVWLIVLDSRSVYSYELVGGSTLCLFSSVFLFFFFLLLLLLLLNILFLFYIFGASSTVYSLLYLIWVGIRTIYIYVDMYNISSHAWPVPCVHVPSRACCTLSFFTCIFLSSLF